DQPVGDVAQRHDRAQRAEGDAVLERRGHALLGHRIGAFDDCERGLHFPNAAYQRVNVNLAAGGWDVFRDDAVRKQEGDSAGDPGVYAQDWRGAAIGERVGHGADRGATPASSFAAASNTAFAAFAAVSNRPRLCSSTVKASWLLRPRAHTKPTHSRPS